MSRISRQRGDEEQRTMSYVLKQLSEDEKVVFQTTLHPIIFLVPALVAVLCVAVGVVLVVTEGSVLGVVGSVVMEIEPVALPLIAFVGAGLVVLFSWVRFISSEFAVTDRRVIIKTGFVSRRTIEIMLTKVEGVRVDQGIVGRILDYGALTVTGSGGTHEPFRMIRRPLKFRKFVQDGSTVGHAEAAQEHLQALQVGGNQIQGRTVAKEDDTLSGLERLGRLRESGVLTQEEFEDQKRRLLDT